MKLKDVMTPSVEVVSPDSTLKAAALKMKALDVGPMPVCDGDKVVGMLTDRDIVVRAVAEGLDPNTPVKMAMTPEVIWCADDEEVETAAKLMQEKQVRRILVMNRDKKMVGIVSLADLAVDTPEEQLSNQVLESVSEPAHPHH
jgi:CBS domain-containing protein